VNPNYGEIKGVPCHRSISDLPEAPDLVAVVVPARPGARVLEECRNKKAGAAVVISAGFAERGTESGQALQTRLAAFAQVSGFRFTGPTASASPT